MKRGSKPNKIKTKCSWCKNKLLLYPYQLKYYKNHFCNNECRNLWQLGKLKIKPEKKKCLNCNNIFIRNTSCESYKYWSTKKCCSHKCAMKNRKKQTHVIYKCDYCKKENNNRTKEYLSRHEFNFCDRKCYALFKEHILPKNRHPRFATGFAKEERDKRAKARVKVSKAILSGKLKRGICEVCGESNGVEGHHIDYDKPLDVQWLCFKHHREAHKRNEII